MSPSGTPESPGRSWMWWAAFFGLPAMYLCLFLRTLWRIGDEGSIVYGAQRVAEGELPYRDFFEVMGPGAFYWLALWFKALGTTWLASRGAVLATALLAAWAIYFLSARIIRRQFVLLPTLAYTILTVPMWSGANHHFDSNTWALLAIASYVHGERAGGRWTALAGVLAGAAATVIPQKGVLVLIALLAAVVWKGVRESSLKESRTTAALLLTTFGGVGLSVVAFYALQGALRDLVYAMAVWPATQYHAVNVVPYAYGLRELFLASWRPGLEAVFHWPFSVVAVAMLAAPFVFVLLLPLLTGVAAVQETFSRFRSTAASTVPSLPPVYWCVGPALFLAECHRPDMKHLVYGSPVLLIVVTHWLMKHGTAGRITLQVVRTCTVALALFIGILALRPGMTVNTRVGHVRVTERDLALDFLQRHVPPGGTAFVYPYYPMYYFVANVRNPTRYSILMHHINTREQFDEAIAALESQKVEYVLWDTFVAGENLTRWFPGYVDPSEDDQQLERYLRRQYVEVGVENGFRVLRRR